MNKIIYFLFAIILLAGCSKSEEALPQYFEPGEKLGAYFCNLNGKGDLIGDSIYKKNCDTLFNNKEYKIILYPYDIYDENNGLILSVTYLLNGDSISSSSTFPFALNYTPNLKPGKYTLSIKPTFSSKYIIWKSNESKVIVL